MRAIQRKNRRTYCCGAGGATVTGSPLAAVAVAEEIMTSSFSSLSFSTPSPWFSSPNFVSFYAASFIALNWRRQCNSTPRRPSNSRENKKCPKFSGADG